MLTFNGIGILVGLILGKPVGILLFSYLSVLFKFSTLPEKLRFKHLIGVAVLGGIGFTMSIFITLLAFDTDDFIEQSKIAVMISSVISALMGLAILKLTFKESFADEPNDQ